MAALFNKKVWARSAGLLALAVVLGVPAAGPKPAQPPIDVVAASTDLDYRNNTLLFRKVRITQGTVSVQADEATATGLAFENSRWEFRGNVHIKVAGGSLSSDEANVSFIDNQIARALITGSPATFEQKLVNSADIAHGRAGTIEYDVSGATVRLQQDAYLTDGRNDITGQTLVYSIREQRVLANPGEQRDERVHITINPRTPDKQAPAIAIPPQ